MLQTIFESLGRRQPSSSSSSSDVYASPARHASLKGFLYKYKREPKLLTGQWVRRYFAVEGQFLRYYRSESAIDEPWRGSIDLTTVKNIEKYGHKGTLAMVISLPERNLMLRAEDALQLDKWCVHFAALYCSALHCEYVYHIES